MASFFQSLRQSSMPKKLLRFALSRLDLLDENALDLENLDFALGRNTVFEFRDVGLVVQKLEKLLELPPAFSIQKAKVLILRVTIPLDVFTSPITVEVDGVDVRLKVASKEEMEHQRNKKRRKDNRAADVVPTAADLAQSFLETQPLEEKKELEEALVAETHDLGASVALSESGSDDESTYGTGQALSLPAFLTDYLQGIVDRMQIRVQGVAFQVDLEVPVDVNTPTTELVTFQLSLDNVNVEGVTTPGSEAGTGQAIVHKDGKRHVVLDNIRAFLISEANVFSSLVPSPSMPSSVASQSPVATQAPSLPHMPLSRGSSFGSDSVTSDDILAQSQYHLQDSEDAFNIPYELEQNRGYGEFRETNSPGSTPRASIYHDNSPPILKQPAQSTLIEPGASSWSVPGREAQSEPFLRPPEGFPLSSGVSPAGSVHSEPLSSNSSIGDEDLTQSHLYSHEEAASMYMSAFSQTQSVKLNSAMPGSWDDIDSQPSEDAPESPARSPEPQQNSSSPELYGSLLGGSISGIPFPTPHSPQATSPMLESDEPLESPDEGQAQEQELPQDDIPTPRGPTRLVKEIVSLSSISVYLPSTHKHIQVVTPELGKSMPDLPGAFSVHSPRPPTPQSPVNSEHPAEPVQHDKSIEIILKPIEVRFDASIAFLLAMVVGRLLEAVKLPSSEAGNPSSSASETKTTDIKLVVEKLSLQFLEKLAGVADTPQRHLEKRTATDFTSEILLQANVVDLRGSLRSSDGKPEADITIDRFKFGYANDNIISFDPSFQMSESVVSTTFSPADLHKDIKISVRTRDGDSEVQINTHTLNVKLDLLRLDETFSWFGGLSGFLNMGSSIASTTSGGAKGPAKAPQKPRGVRFEAPIDPNDRSAAKENKINLRINGVRVDVIGRDSSVVLDTTSLKLVSREEGLAVVSRRIRLAGPSLRNSHTPAPVVAEIYDTRLEFFTTPRGQDLERLLELITPSKIKFDADEDEIMVDTLLRQRRKGSVLSLNVGGVKVDAGMLQQLGCLPSLVEDLAKLGTVAKYLPEDDRPGLLTLARLEHVECEVHVGGRFGTIRGSLADLEVAHISVPALAAVAVSGINVTRNRIEELITTPPAPKTTVSHKPPVLMMRIIDDIEPVLKVNLNGLNVEYRVPTIMDILELGEDATPQDFEAGLAASVANLGDHAHAALKRAPSSSSSVEQTQNSKSLKVDVKFWDCSVGLNPLGLTSKLAVVLTEAHLEVVPGKQETVHAVASLKKVAVLLIDDVSILNTPGASFATIRKSQVAPSQQVAELCTKGYVNICQISAAKATVKSFKDPGGETQLEVEVRDDLLVLETCADSTQTLIALANALKPPTPPSKEIKYRTSVVPVEDLLASITADAFGRAEGDYDFDKDFALPQDVGGDTDSESSYYGGKNDSPLNMDSQFYDDDIVQEELFDATTNSMLMGDAKSVDTNDGVLLSTASLGGESGGSGGSGSLSVTEGFFETKAAVHGTAHRWNSRKNQYDEANDARVQRSPFKVGIRDVHVIWNLFDGYDWARTREVITKAVADVEAKAYERKAKADRKVGFDQDLEEEEIVGDFLFNSIYIGIPANRDPRELAQAINNELQDMNDTESIATTAVTSTTVRAAGKHRSGAKSLKLNRSKRHKITFELRGVNVDLVTYPPDVSETMSSVDVRVNDLDVYDHVPTSTWKKFAMYDHDAGERELGTSMVHLELLNTRPVPSMPASEMVLKVTVLPLRLHVDQDALEFITRFFEFKDDSVPVHASPTDIPFIQRAEVNDIPVKLDFKPKRVDYAGLRSGHTTEFMNFMILEDARLTLRHVILYGVSGFDRLGEQLNDIWTDNVKRTQLPGILAGLAPVRSLVNAGSGFKDLIEIPIREYRKDGRIVRSITKGATAFAKTTGTEVVKLGAKLALGTQNALQGAEGLLVPSKPAETSNWTAGTGSGATGGLDDWEEGDYAGADEDTQRQISLYANQPLGIIQGMRGAYASLARDLSLARDAIIAVPAEVMESQNAQGAAQAVLKRAPTIIFRPAIGATKAIGQTLLGATNSLDPGNRRRAEEKYKKH
ncbi:putative autophagy-related protein 2 [Podospora australis]|uniref:Autophagy-related protein 2 n=1 Tax=Podospora australis TaxID=1536484 RepID=A0AAN7AJ81_9PEZI|nr:putative autophagy-related protein 2 [Podospora australis]